MGLPRGLKHFSNFFKEYEDRYVIIGGSAASAYLDDSGLEFRATKDIDMVLFTNDSSDLNNKISEYISLGKYDVKERTDDSPRYYRFSKPENTDFPEIVEIFAKVDSTIELREGQYIVPVTNTSEAQLSAILLDEEYFNLIKNNSIKSDEGYSIINAYANISLKARAYRELSDRGEESKKIRKHLKDVLRLAQVLDRKKFPISGRPKEDFEIIYEALSKFSAKEVKQVIGSTVTKDTIFEILDYCFRQ